MSGAGISHEREILIGPTMRKGADAASSWQWPTLLLCFSAGGLLLELRQTAWAMVDTWESSKTYSHCFLVVPLVLYLVWLSRKRLLSITPSPSVWGLTTLSILTAVWLLANLGEIKVVQEFTLIAIVAALVWTLFGAAVLRVLAFPLAFLLFAVPFGVTLVAPLQNFTAWFAVHTLTLSSVPAVLENHTIFLPTSTWTVGETCSGIRYLFASTVFGVFYSSLVYRSIKRRCLFVLISIALPIVANGVRAYGIVLLSYLTNYRLAAGVDHVIYGGVFFIVLQIALMSIGLRWRENPEDYAPVASGDPVTKTGKLKIRQGLAAVAAIAIVGAAPLLARHLWEGAEANSDPLELSVAIDPSWQQSETFEDTWGPDFRNPERQFRRQYQHGEHRVDLCWAYYSGRNPTLLDNAAKGYGNPQFWSRASKSVGLAMLNGQEVTVEKEMLQSGTNLRPVWTVFWVAGEYTASAARVKLLQARARLLGKSAATGVIVLGSDDAVGGANAAHQTLQNFLAHAQLSVSPIS